MKFRNNKGVTGVDISVALIIIVLFVGIISSLVYNFAISSRNINRKAIATNIAINKIEQLKYDFINNINDAEGTTTEYANYSDSNGSISYDSTYKTPYSVETTITKFGNYTDSSYIQSLTPTDKRRILDENLLKIVDVTVSYSVGNKEETIQIKTAITRED